MPERPIIERPAEPPRIWTAAVFTVLGAVEGLFMMGGWLLDADMRRLLVMSPGFVGMGLGMLGFAFIIGRTLVRPSERRAFLIVTEEGCTRVGPAGPAWLAAILVLILPAPLLAVVIGAAVRDGLTPRATWALLACEAAAITALAIWGATAYRRQLRSGKCTFVIDRAAEVLRIPSIRVRQRRHPARDIPLGDVQAVIILSHPLRLGGMPLKVRVRGETDIVPVARETGFGLDSFAGARWLADELRVPLIERCLAPPTPAQRTASVRAWALIVYLLLLSISDVYGLIAHFRALGRTPAGVTVVAVRAAPPGARSLLSIAYRCWPASTARPPVILIHGSPGTSEDFDRLGPALQRAGCSVLAPDLPGFGASDPYPPNMSAEFHARTLLGLINELHIPRAHIVGWSLGGAVALNMADLAPDRIASLTLMASVSEQATEGSGNYSYEHAKYAAGWTLATALRYGVPHFGLLSGLDVMRASMRNFWDTDLRPLRGIMERLQTPTLILHGWRDFLAPVHDSFRSHELIGPSTLVLLDGTHFIPFMHVDAAASVLVPFFARHDTPGVPALRQTIMLDPEPRPILGPPGALLDRLILASPWWLTIALITIGMLRRDRLTAVLAVLLVGFVLLDFGVVMGGVLLGQALLAARSIRRGRALRRASAAPRIIGSGLLAQTPDDWRWIIRRDPLLAGLGSRFIPGRQDVALEAAAFTRSLPPFVVLGVAASWVLWALLFAIVTLLTSALLVHPLADKLGALGLLAGTLIAIYLPRPIALLLTRDGRRLLRISFHRATRREYWPTTVQYALLSPVLLRLSLRHGLLAYTCCNPGIGGGGGMIGESKKEILDSLAHSPHALAAALIEPGPDPASRARAAIDAIAARPELGGLPIILKPDAGQRGFAVKIARTPEDVETYFCTVTSPVLVQRFHPGPCECGIVWMRSLGYPHAPRGDSSAGSIFSITRKTFPILTGDGRHTLEDLILRHPRYHCQASVFLERFADQRRRVLAEGETLRLAQSGNHCQGTLFTDGADLITPQLESAIDTIARSIDPPLDAGRFDLRYESDDSLRRGTGFAIVELNGTAGESTNIYDPDKSIFWGYRTLAAQWRLLYELGAERQRQGAKPMTIRALLREIRKHYRERTGPALAD